MSDAPHYQPGPPQPSAPLTAESDRQWASFAHLGGILGFLPALIIWLVFKDRGQFTDQEGKEALNFQIMIAIAQIVAQILTVVSFGLLAFLPFVVWVFSLIFSILGFVKAKDGLAYRYPITIRFIK
jgi:uncharacterized Tic20 family protein